MTDTLYVDEWSGVYYDKNGNRVRIGNDWETSKRLNAPERNTK